MLRDFLDFFDAPLATSFTLAPEEAIAFFKGKGLRESFSWADLTAEEHVASFTVAKMMDSDLLADVHASLLEAMENGTPYRAWADDITPMLKKKGWWGEKVMDDPLTGQVQVVKFGTPGRLKTIFRTNMQSAYAVGQWTEIQQQAADAPFLMYDAVDDHRTRPEHAAWDDKIYPVDSQFWKDHYPPNGWNCRCGVIQLSEGDLADLGLEPSSPFRGKLYEWKNPRTGKTEWIPEGIDPGFAINAGEERLQALTKLALEKVKAAEAELAAAMLEGMKKAEEEAKSKLAAEVAAVQKDLAASIGKAQLERSVTKAATRSAQWQIDQAVAQNTPYLAKAIQALQKTAAGKAMTPPELLAAAKLQAAKVKDSAALANWKQAYLADKKLPAAGQAVFDALPDDAKGAMLAQMDAQKAAAAAEKAAKLELAKLASGDYGKTEASMLAKLQASPEFQALPPIEQVAKLKADVAAYKAGISQTKGVNGFVKAAIAGKIPTPLQKAAFDALDDETKAKLLAKIDAEKALPPSPPDPETQKVATLVSEPEVELSEANLVQTGPQKGSNPGGKFRDTETGIEWYIKTPPSASMAVNEAVAGALYRLAGVDVPELRVIQFNGQTSIASRIVDGLTKDAEALQRGLPGVADGFAVDAWLANWDVIGLGYDNLLVKAGRAFRVDTGGALIYRAQGGLKGAAWGDDVLEIDSLRDGRKNAQAASVFGKLTQQQIEDSVRRVLAITDEQIYETVGKFGRDDDMLALARRLIARREDLARRFPNARPKVDAPPAPLPAGRVTVEEQREIEASRANGFTINTDKDQIEDHHVVISTYLDKDGNRKTRVALKVRPDAGKKLDEQVKKGAGVTPTIEGAALKAKALELLKGINSRAANGSPIDDTTATRWNQLKAMVNEWQADVAKYLPDVKDAEQLRASVAAVKELVDMLDPYMRAHPMGAAATALPLFDLTRIAESIETKPKKREGVSWAKLASFPYNLASFRRGVQRETGEGVKAVGAKVSYKAKVDGVEVRYIPYDPGNTFAAQGYMQFDLDGVGADVTEKAFDTLERLGLNSSRAGPADRLELYVDKIGHIRALRNPALRAKLDRAAAVDDQKKRTEEKLAAINEDAGFDVRTSPRWNPQGRPQAFGHGRVTSERPDIREEDLRRMEKALVIYHNPSGLGVGGDAILEKVQRIVEAGGQFASQVDRLRRGVKPTGSSVASDFQTGGASYVFTRLLSRSSQKVPGIYWKPKMALRTDAITYSGDKFGEATRAMQEGNRARTVDEIISHSRGGSNETIFRDAVSLFDDLEGIVLNSRRDYDAALQWFRENGYSSWPDGRPLEEVLDYPGSGRGWK